MKISEVEFGRYFWDDLIPVTVLEKMAEVLKEHYLDNRKRLLLLYFQYDNRSKILFHECCLSATPVREPSLQFLLEKIRK